MRFMAEMREERRGYDGGVKGLAVGNGEGGRKQYLEKPLYRILLSAEPVENGRENGLSGSRLRAGKTFHAVWTKWFPCALL